MHGVPGDGARKWPVAAVALALLAVVVWWLGFREPSPELVRDFEGCAEQVQAKPLSNNERGALMTQCYARFAGRRKRVETEPRSCSFGFTRKSAHTMVLSWFALILRSVTCSFPLGTTSSVTTKSRLVTTQSSKCERFNA